MSSFLRAVACQARIVKALILREFRLKFGQQRLGLVWLFIEPLLHITVLVFLRVVILGRGGDDPRDFVLFLITGLLPFFCLMKTTLGVTGSSDGKQSVLIFPIVNLFDVALAKMIFEVVSNYFVLCLFLLLFYFFIKRFELEDVYHASMFFVIFGVFGMCYGIILRPIIAMFPGLNMVFRTFFRLLYLTSGVIIPVDRRLSGEILEYAAYNPITHLLEFFRSILMLNHHALHLFLDWQYAIGFALVMLIIGGVVEKRFKNRMTTDDG